MVLIHGVVTCPKCHCGLGDASKETTHEASPPTKCDTTSRNSAGNQTLFCTLMFPAT